MQILHLGLEDPRRPGSGGGSVRNREVNRRLAARGHEIEFVTARYPGSRRRLEDGIAYRQIGLGVEYFSSLLSYQALLPRVVLGARARRRPPDVVVEEFAPPWSTLGVNRWSSIPTVGCVQGYFAAEKAEQYHLPRGLLEGVQRWGTRGHSHLIAGSDELARRLETDAPEAQIAVIPLGVAHEEIAAALADPPTPVPRQLVFLGRLEIEQKGLDLLIEAVDGLLEEEDATLVIAGDGRDAGAVRALAAAGADSARISFRGRVGGAEKWRLLAESQACMMPSRYETFGLSAIEALACGTPVVGFDIESLRDTVPAAAGVLVAPFDVTSLREATRALLRDGERSAALGRRGREHSAAFTWDRVADRQEAVYAAAVAAASSPPPQLAGRRPASRIETQEENPTCRR